MLVKNRLKIEEIMNNAINSGEIVTIKYWGGSRPGEKREIFPVRVDGFVWAKCMKTNKIKSYYADKIEVVEDEAA